MKNSIKVFLLFIVITTVSFVMISNKNENLQALEQPKWNPDALKTALNADLVRWANDPNVNTEYAKYSAVYTGKALNYLSLVAFYDKNNSFPEVTDRVIEQLRYIISGGKEPCCRGVIAGWADNSLAQSITLAKNTDMVWSQFNKEEKAKFDLLMKSLAIAGNYCQNSKNDVHTGLYQSFNWRKGWNPNHQEGYVGVMIAAYIYFKGADNVNKIFSSFDFDSYLQDLKKAGFINIVSCWQTSGKELMENGGDDKNGGKTVGVKIPFTYSSLVGFGEIEYAPYFLYRDLATRMFYYEVTSKECDGEAYIIDGTTSPYEGQLGMCYEFRTQDASGCRSSAGYCFDGWMNNTLTLASLQAFELLPDTQEYKDLVKKIKTGVADLDYKLQHGYRGRKNSKYVDEYEKNLYKLGYVFIKDIYDVISEEL